MDNSNNNFRMSPSVLEHLYRVTLCFENQNVVELSQHPNEPNRWGPYGIHDLTITPRDLELKYKLELRSPKLGNLAFVQQIIHTSPGENFVKYNDDPSVFVSAVVWE